MSKINFTVSSADTASARRAAQRLLEYKRYHHCVCVARAAARLARRYGWDPTRAAVAGYLHDIARELPRETLLELCTHPHIATLKDEEYLKNVIHSYAGAELIEKSGIRDTDIINAVRYHTTAKPDMTVPEMILYVADEISADRTFKQARWLRRIANRSLEKAFAAVLRENCRHLTQTGRKIAPITLEAVKQLDKE